MEGERPDDDALLEGMSGLPRELVRGAEAPAGLREAILSRTTAVIRSRRRRRRGVLALVAIGVYACGLATPRLVAVKLPEAPLASVAPPAAPADAPAGSAAAPPSPALTPAAAPRQAGIEDPAETLRSVIDAPPGERARLLREVGDAYLSSHGDVEAALYCYRQVLELSPASRGRPESGDTWLLAALKSGQSDSGR
jgi:hypothetical protein